MPSPPPPHSSQPALPGPSQSRSSARGASAASSSSSLRPRAPPPASTPNAQLEGSKPAASGSQASANHSDSASPDAGQTDTATATTHPNRKPRVHLAPNQPLTTRGKPRERVFVACVQCRSRKVRCDGGKPECYSCSRRPDLDTDPCSYDAAPRRRGKDRTPGSRKMAPYIPKKTRTTRSRLEEEAKQKKALESQAGPSRPAERPKSSRASSLAARQSVAREPGRAPAASPAGYVPFDIALEAILRPSTEFLLAPEYNDPRAVIIADERNHDEDEAVDIGTEPSIAFTRETWWDALLALYAAPSDRLHLAPGALTVDVRNTTSERIAADLRFLFQTSVHWFSFINIPRFFSSLFNPSARRAIQPSLILATLAVAVISQSSEMELGAKGREKALRLNDQAHAAFDASISSGWIDVGLVQAAWMLAIFEIQAHPKLCTHRTREGMAMLDSLIRFLSLTTLDVDDPRATVFVPHAVPIVRSNPALIATYNSAAARSALSYAGSASAPVHGPTGVPRPGKWQCACDAHALAYHWPVVKELAPQWAQTPAWPNGVSEGEMQKEECRRLVWASVMLAATHSTKTTAGTDWEPQHLWIKDPSNYALLFPGESLSPPGMEAIASSKDSVWALYMRTLLLWHSCLRMRCDMSLNDADRAQRAMSAWLEIDTIEGTLDRHGCLVENGFLLQLREILFNTRMCVSHEFQRFIPEATTAPGQLFYHDKAEQWLTYQLGMAHYFTGCLRNPKVDPDDHSRRNFLMFWFMSQITRALALWEADRTLTIALDVARAFAPCTEYLMLLWPTPSQRTEYEVLRARLVQTCIEAGVPPPEGAMPHGGAGHLASI